MAPKDTLKKLSLSVGVLVVLLLVAELVVRASGLAPVQFAQTRHLETDDKRVGLDLYPSDERDAFDVDLGDAETLAALRTKGLDASEYAEHTPHGIELRYSAELCRGGDVPPKSERTRIMIVGDSFAEGQGVREDETSAAQLQERLGDSYEVLNCGRRGYDVSDVANFLERHLETLEPDVVLYAYTLNDPEQSEAFAAQQTFLDDWILARRQMVSEGPGGLSFFQSHLLAALKDRLEGASVGQATTTWYRDMVMEPNAEGWTRSLEHIDAMKALSSSLGADFEVVIQPLLVDLDGVYPFEGVHEKVLGDLEARGISVTDALPNFAGQDAPSLWVHACDRHPNRQAQGLIADSMARALEDLR
ncbi:MAG: SGNH/GDSL hydrolase family protein [Polyangiales bacterium]